MRLAHDQPVARLCQCRGRPVYGPARRLNGSGSAADAVVLDAVAAHRRWFVQVAPVEHQRLAHQGLHALEVGEFPAAPT